MQLSDLKEKLQEAIIRNPGKNMDDEKERKKIQEALDKLKVSLGTGEVSEKFLTQIQSLETLYDGQEDAQSAELRIQFHNQIKTLMSDMNMDTVVNSLSNNLKSEYTSKVMELQSQYYSQDQLLKFKMNRTSGGIAPNLPGDALGVNYSFERWQEESSGLPDVIFMDESEENNEDNGQSYFML